MVAVKRTMSDAVAASLPESMVRTLQELAIAVFGHPAGAGEMGVVDVTGALRVIRGVETEQDRHDLAPIRAVRSGVEQAQVKCRMRPVIIGQCRALRRRVKEVPIRHADPPCTTIAVIVSSVTISKPGNAGRMCGGIVPDCASVLQVDLVRSRSV